MSKARIVRATERREVPLDRDRGMVEQIIDASVGARQVDMHINRLRAGGLPGRYHLHTTSENVYLVVSGEVTVRIEGVEHRLGPGDGAVIPPGVPHGVRNDGDVDVELIEIYSPVGADHVEVEEDATTA